MPSCDSFANSHSLPNRDAAVTAAAPCGSPLRPNWTCGYPQR
ncbi:hypothetical protein [Lysobacter gummosus]